MQLETFRGSEPRKVAQQVREVLGEDAMIIRTRTRRVGGRELVEVVAASGEAVESFRQRLDGSRVATERRSRGLRRVGPYVIALVGPTGAGKTTAAMKMALHPKALGQRKVGLVTLDTFRPGAVEELQTYAEIAGLPMEVLYHSQELPAALQRLRDRDVIVVDTPGRSPRTDQSGAEWRQILEAMQPDEVHLVLPAGLRLDVAVRVKSGLADCGTTHVLFSKLDEAGGDEGLAELAQSVGLPARWVADGQEIPADLLPAEPRILGALGLAPSAASAAPLEAAG
jgi:flagellar biosynthesis protein FlhF